MAKLKSNLSKIAAAAPVLAGKALRQTGADIAQITKQLVPVRTGDLQRSYKSEPINDELVLIGSDLEYAPHVEFGTYKMIAQPALIPAMAQAEPTYRARLIQAIKELNG